MAALGWVDMALMAVLLLSMAVGLWRGLVFELLSLAGWLVAFVLAQAYAPDVGARLPIGTPGSALNLGVALVLTFIATLIIWTLLAKLVRMALHATPLTVIDRVLGGGFGLLRGLLLLLVVATLVTFTPAARSADWTASHGAAWLGVVLQGLKPVLPAEVARHLPG